MREISGYVFVAEMAGGSKHMYGRGPGKIPYHRLEFNGIVPYVSLVKALTSSAEFRGTHTDCIKTFEATLDMKVAESLEDAALFKRSGSLVFLSSDPQTDHAQFYGPRVNDCIGHDGWALLEHNGLRAFMRDPPLPKVPKSKVLPGDLSRVRKSAFDNATYNSGTFIRQCNGQANVTLATFKLSAIRSSGLFGPAVPPTSTMS